MTAIDSRKILAAVPQSLVSTGVNEGTELASGALQAWHDAWDRIVDDYLIEWGRNPATVRDEDMEAPTRAAIDCACQFALSCREVDAPPPTRVVPDGEGGIAFERYDEASQVVLSIDSDGSAELLVFHECQLVERVRLT